MWIASPASGIDFQPQTLPRIKQLPLL